VWATWAAGIYIAASTVAMVVATWIPVPIGDQWDELVSARNVSWSWLISQHSEHRILIPRLVFLADRWWFGETNVVDFVVNVLALGATSLLLVAVANGRRPSSLIDTTWTTGLSLALLFWAIQAENLVWGIQVCVFLVSFFAVAAFSALALLPSASWALAMVLFIETMAAYTFGNGIIVAFLMIPMAMLLGRSRAHVLVLAVYAMALLGFYLIGYETPSWHSDPTYAWRHAPSVVLYMLAEVGSPFASALTWIFQTENLKFAIAFGGAAITSFIIVAWRLVRRRGADNGCQLVLLAVMCFVLGTAFLTALGRAERFGIEQALDSRYTTTVLLFWYCLAVLSLDIFRRVRIGYILAMTALTCPLIAVVVSQPLIVKFVEAAADERRLAVPVLLSGVHDSALLENIVESHPEEDIVQQLDLLKKAHTSVFASEWGHWLGTPISEHLAMANSAGCVGGFELAEQITATNPGGWRAYGSALGPSRRPVQRIILADGSGKVAGFGANVTVTHDAWFGSFGANDPGAVRAYALVDQGRAACSLGTPKRIELLPTIELLPDVPPPLSRGGSIDTFEIGERTVVSGWGMLSVNRDHQRVGIYTNLPVSSVSMSRVPRTDIAQAFNEESLARSGIRVVLSLTPDSAIPSRIKLCIETWDSKYGNFLLQSSSNPGLCPTPAAS
jgi:hypothetical protein